MTSRVRCLPSRLLAGVLGPSDGSCRPGVGLSIETVKRQGTATERPEARGAVVGRWFLPEWWVSTLPPERRDKSILRLAQFAAAVAALALVLLLLAAY